MKRLESLQHIANSALGGLTADTALKATIRLKGSESQTKRQGSFRSAVGVAMSFLVVMVCVTFIAPKPAVAPEAISDAHVYSMTAGDDSTVATRALLNLEPENFALTQSMATPEQASIWAAKNDADFPLLFVDGRYYRLLQSPLDVSDTLLGSALGQVKEFTSEPSLSKGDVLMSNVVRNGEIVYTLSGMDGAAVAAKVDGDTRVFQRISYAGNARIGQESLSDTLKLSNVKSISLSDVGSISNEKSISVLVQTLLSNASYKDASLLNSGQALLIEMESGITLQLMVKDDTVSACGSWSCPEFFEAFARAME